MASSGRLGISTGVIGSGRSLLGDNTNNNNDGVGGGAAPHQAATGGASTSASSAAMNLFEKFNALTRGIDETREEQKQTRIKIESILQATTQTRQNRDSMKREIVTANLEAQKHHREIDDENEALFEMEGQRGQALMDQQQAKRELDQMKSYIDEQRRKFLEKSREFRASCKRGRLQSSILGLEYAPTKAFATVMVVGDAEEINSIAAANNKKRKKPSRPGRAVVMPSDFDEPPQPTVYLPASTKEGRQGNNRKKGDKLDADPKSNPRHWFPDPRDDVMKQSLQEHQKELERQQEVNRSLEEVKSNHKRAIHQAKSRSNRKEQLLSQLNRIKKDCEGIENEIAQVQEQTDETKQLGLAFEKDVRTKRQEIAQRRFENGITGNQNQNHPPPPRDQHRRPFGAGGHIRTANPYARRNTSNQFSSSSQQQQQQQSGPGGSDNRHNDNGDSRRGGMSSSRNNNLASSRASTTNSNNRGPPTHQHTTPTLSQQQYPHRAGCRIRLGKQFKNNVSITAPLAQAASASTTTNRPQQQNQFSILVASDDDSDDSNILSFVTRT